ncbi:hypothetical protein [Tsuneonella mangrovi]|uniref:hypothetical protein n=1 Tax=Tsuneonella mangrovi TaxID=1982042 RepID=UPI000BA2571D|nr:hypothetical protein [Tsuneonella mangrovi]
MNLDDLLHRYFASSEPSNQPADVQAVGIEKILVDFGLERDRGKRFALWCLFQMLGAAPDLDVAVENPADRDAARNFMDLLAASEE